MKLNELTSPSSIDMTLWQRLAVMSASFAAVLLAGSLPAWALPEADRAAAQADELTIVDCLLPAPVRKLGRAMTYLGPRRPMQTTAGDCEIRGGEYVAYDRSSYASALKVWLPQAEAGDAKAQTHVGEIYEKGLGLEPDFALAVAWYRKAADQGYSRAQINLGYLYEAGLGVEADAAMALNLYREASGLVDDDLMYVSTSEAQLGELRDEMNTALAAADAQTRELRASLDKSESRLADRRRSLEAAQRELTQTRSNLAMVSNDTGPAANPQVSDQDAEEIERLQEELSLREQLIERQRESIAALAQQTDSQHEALIARLADAEDSDAMLRAELAAARQLLDDTSSALAQARTAYDAELTDKQRYQAELERERAAAQQGEEQRVRELAQQLTQREADLVVKDLEIASLEQQLAAYNRRVAQIEASRPQLTMRTIDARPQPAPAPLLSPAVVSNTVNFGNYYALVIGNNSYTYLPGLDTAINDARAVDRVLRTKYGYRTTLLSDASRVEILTALNDLRQKLNENDNLLIYYAGHGELDRKNLAGYWMPVDARPEDTTNWISDDQITRQLNLMSARHIIVVADSCYSGAMTRNTGARLEAGRSPEAQVKRLKFLSKLPSRTVLTSGGEKPVLDGGGGEHSVFARSFLQVLKENNEVLEGQALYRRVFDDVRKSAALLKFEQKPQYSGIADAGHLNGEFLFVPRG